MKSTSDPKAPKTTSRRRSENASDLMLDMWADPEDVALTEVETGNQARMNDLVRIGRDIRKSADEVMSNFDD